MKIQKTAFFFFAHQDDEFGVYGEIQRALKAGDIVRCAYLTDGATGKTTSEIRNKESLSVLTRLGVSPSNVYFTGSSLNISDGQLAYHFEPILNWLEGLTNHPTPLLSLYIPAWEGGHHDHDALHAILVIFAERKNLLNRCWQFPLYHSHKCPRPFFRTLSPLSENGVSHIRPIHWKDRCLHLMLCLSYLSQFKTWLGLFPFVFCSYVFIGTQRLQKTSTQRIHERPHNGKLLYERRGRFDWEELEDLICKVRPLT